MKRLLILLTLFAGLALAAGTTIQGTVYLADGVTPANGWVQLSSEQTGTIQVLIYNGALMVQLEAPATYLARYTFTNGTQRTETWSVPVSTTTLTVTAVSQQSNTTGTPGPIAYSQLQDLNAALLNNSGIIGASCIPTLPCVVRGGFQYTAPVTISSPSGTGTVFVWINASGAIIAGHNLVSLTCSTGITCQSGVNSFPTGVYPLSSWTVTGGQFAAPVDLRASLGRDFYYTAENLANRGAAGGYAPLDVNSLVPAVNLPPYPGAASTTPNMDGAAAVGTSSAYARADHVHPSDTSRVATTTTVNGHALSANVSVTPSDLSLVIGTNTEAWSANLDAWSGKTGPTGAVVGTSDTQTLTNKTVDGVTPATFAFLDPTSSVQTQLNGKQASGTYAGVGNCTAGQYGTGTATGTTQPCAQVQYSQVSGTPSIPAASSTTPNMDGTAAVGVGTTFARADHVHPSDTSRVATTTTVNGHALSANVSVTPSDLSLVIGTNTEAWSANLDAWSGKTGPTGAVVGTSDTQTLTNKTVDGVTPATFAFLDPTSSVQTQLNGKQASGTYAGVGNCTAGQYGTGTATGTTQPCAQVQYSQVSGTPSIPAASSTTPNMDGTGAVGTSGNYARADHTHPSDTSRVATTTTVNGHALSANVSVTPSDLSLVIGTNTEAWSANLDAWSGKTGPTGAVVGTSDTQTLTNKTVDGVTPATFAFLDPTSSVQTQLNGKQASGTYAGVGNCTAGQYGTGTATGTTQPCAQVQYSQVSGTPSIPAASSTTPNMDGTGAVGTSSNFARADHTHPTDTSRQAALGYTAENAANKNVASGYAPLDSAGLLPNANLQPTVSVTTDLDAGGNVNAAGGLYANTNGTSVASATYVSGVTFGSACTFTITGGGGSGAVFTSTGTLTSGASLTYSTGGSGYTSNPTTATVSGTGCSGTPVLNTLLTVSCVDSKDGLGNDNLLCAPASGSPSSWLWPTAANTPGSVVGRDGSGNFAAGTGTFTRLLAGTSAASSPSAGAGSIWGGSLDVADPGTLAATSLTNGALTSPYTSSWTATNDCSLTGTAATCTFSAGTASVVTQGSGQLAIAGVGNVWYKFTYDVTSVSGAPTAAITSVFASTGTAVPLTAGTGNVIYFRSAASPGNFTVSTTLTTSGQTFTLDNLSLQQVTGGTISAAGGFLGNLPASYLTGTLQAAQEPAHTGDATNTAGSLAMTVSKINGTSLAGLATGILKNTTATGVPSIAAAGTDYMAPSTSVAATQMPALTGDVTTTAGTVATSVVKVNGAVVPTSAALVATNASNQLIAATTTGTGSTAVLANAPTITGKLTTSGIVQSAGTKPTISGCGTPTTQTGGAFAGTFTALATSCTAVLTFTLAATNGWYCPIANDLTTTTDSLHQTASSTTTATLSGTVVSGDVINFGCTAY